MSSFTKPLVLEFRGLREWVVAEQFCYHIGDEDSSDIVLIMPGFTTDGATVPRILWPFFPPWGTWGKAAVVHDYLYNRQSFYRAGDDATPVQVVPITRKRADDIFWEAMTVLRVGFIARICLYTAVRLWGLRAWLRKRHSSPIGELLPPDTNTNANGDT